MVEARTGRARMGLAWGFSPTDQGCPELGFSPGLFAGSSDGQGLKPLFPSAVFVGLKPHANPRGQTCGSSQHD